MADKRPLTLNANGTKELLQPGNSLDIGGYTLPNTAGSTDDLLVMGAANAEWTPLSTVIDGNAYDKTGWDASVFSEVTLTFTNGTRTVAIAPMGASASYYIAGIKYTFTTEQSVVIDDTEGLWYIYFNGSTLTASQTLWTFDDTKCFVATLYWDATNNINIGWAPELHSWVMQDRLHHYLHNTFGTRYNYGLGVAEATTSTVDVAIGKLFDEDIQINITDEVGSGWWDQVLSPLTAPIYYRTGAGLWRKIAASTSLCYLDTNVPQVNIFSGTWQWQAVTTNRYFAYWVVSSSSSEYPVYIVPGQESADKLSDTIAGNLLADMDFEGLPTEEHKVIARLIFRRIGSGAYYEITQIDDYRYAKDENAGAGTTVSDHGGLTGLADDDHTQYHNDARAAAWINAGFNVSGDIKSNADAAKHYFGESDDYNIQWDGGNAVHTISAGAFEFDGGAIRLPTFNTTQRNALTPAEGFIIYNSTTKSVEKYEDAVWSAGQYTLPLGGNPEDFLKRTAGGYVWTTTFTSTLGVGALNTTGNITIDSDSNGLVLGDDTDYNIKWDGDNAVHTIVVTAAFEFDGGAIRLPNVTTTQRDALTAVANGMMIYNTTDEKFQMYENGSWVEKVTAITSPLDLYVKLSGDDSTGDGSSGNAWATVDKALTVVADWTLLDHVTINIEKGNYSDTDTLVISHSNGNFINIVGDYTIDTLTLSSVSGSSGNYDYIFTTANTSKYTTNDYVLIYDSSSGSNFKRVRGPLKVISINAGVSVTLNSSASASASGAVSASASIPQVKFIRKIEQNSDINLIAGIQTLYSLTIIEDVFKFDSLLPFTVNFEHCIWVNTNASVYGGMFFLTGNQVYAQYCGSRNMYRFMYAQSDSLINLYKCVMLSCNKGVSMWGGGKAFTNQISIISCVIGAQVDVMSLLVEYTGISFDLCGTNSSPAQNTEGNSNSFIYYVLL